MKRESRRLHSGIFSFHLMTLGILLTLVTSCGASLRAAAPITSPDGATLKFSEWSSFQPFMLKSSQGQSQALRKTCTVRRQYAAKGETIGIEMVMHPRSADIWIGEKPEHYLIVGDRIWGMNCHSGMLLIKASESTGPDASGAAALVDRFSNKLVGNPSTKTWIDGEFGYKLISLTSIFGLDMVIPVSTTPPDSITIADVQVNKDGIELSLASKNGRNFRLTVSEAQRVTSAYAGPDRFPVMYDGSAISDEIREWSGLGNRRIDSATGKVNAVYVSRNYMIPDAEYGERILVDVIAIVLAGTGDLWIGPTDCELIKYQDKLLGFKFSKENPELLIFTGPGTQVPMASGSAVFWDELRRFDLALRSNDYQHRPEIRVNLSDSLSRDSRLGNRYGEYRCRSVQIEDNTLVVTCNSDSSQAYPEIVLGPDLKAVSFNVLSVEQLREKQKAVKR
jgi:hypothetical protein